MAIVRGEGAYRLLKFEGGIHRVQRVPKTEKAGRIHTSTVSVAVMPQPSEVSYKDGKDVNCACNLKILKFREKNLT